MAERIEPVEEFPPVPKQLLWMFDGIDRKEATKMMHDYALSAITWKPSKALLRAWEDVQNATDKTRRLEDENERLNLELQKRDKCSFMGPMRDCPTHGESKDAARYRWLRDERPVTIDTMLHGNGCRARSADELDAAIDAAMLKTPNVEFSGQAAASSPRSSAGTQGSASPSSKD